MEDAIGLADALVRSGGELAPALAAYESERRVEVLKLQNAARNSTEWFENVARYAELPDEQFAYSLLTRSQRIGHENLRLRDSAYVERVEEWFGGVAIPRCSLRSVYATSSCVTALSFRPWIRTARSTDSPTTSISCIWAAARWAARAWCLRR